MAKQKSTVLTVGELFETSDEQVTAEELESYRNVIKDVQAVNAQMQYLQQQVEVCRLREKVLWYELQDKYRKGSEAILLDINSGKLIRGTKGYVETIKQQQEIALRKQQEEQLNK